jgi:glucose-6-phosphate dehydrogenase assembly protein OpcA
VVSNRNRPNTVNLYAYGSVKQMAKKVLGQSNPSATTATTLYTVPSAKEAVVSSISIANLTATAATFRIAIRPAGATIANEHYIIYDLSLSATATFTYTSGVTLAATDVVTVYSANGTSSFNAFGSEIA